MFKKMDMDTQTVSAGPGTHGRRDDARERAQAWREPRPVQVSPLQVDLMRQMVPPPSSAPKVTPSTPPRAWHTVGHLRAEGASEPQHTCVSVGSRQQWLRTQRVVSRLQRARARWTCAWVGCAQAWACSGLKTSTSGLTFWSRSARARQSCRPPLQPRWTQPTDAARHPRGSVASGHRKPAYAARRPPMRGRDLCAAACRECGAQICASRHDA